MGLPNRTRSSVRPHGWHRLNRYISARAAASGRYPPNNAPERSPDQTANLAIPMRCRSPRSHLHRRTDFPEIAPGPDKTSLLLCQRHWIREGVSLHESIPLLELPLRARIDVSSPVDSRGDFYMAHLFVGNISDETLHLSHREFDFGDVRPPVMHRRGVITGYVRILTASAGSMYW